MVSPNDPESVRETLNAFSVCLSVCASLFLSFVRTSMLPFWKWPKPDQYSINSGEHIGTDLWNATDKGSKNLQKPSKNYHFLGDIPISKLSHFSTQYVLKVENTIKIIYIIHTHLDIPSKENYGINQKC